MRSFDPFSRVAEALTQTGPISGGRAKPAGGDNVLAKAANISGQVDESGQLAATLGEVREVLGELQQLPRALR